jgi:hypothetical protein
MNDETIVEEPRRTDKDRVVDLLNEALSGNSGKSKKTLIREALKIIQEAHSL